MSGLRPRLWVFNQHYPPDALATAAIVEAVCHGLADLGWDVTVFAGHPYLLAETTPAATATNSAVRVVRLPSWNRRTGTLGRLLHYGVYTWAALGQWLRRDVPDLCLCLSTPPILAAAVGAAGKQLRGVPFVYNTQDLFPDILQTSRYADTWIETVARRLAGPVERQAAHIVPIGTQMADCLRQRGISSQRLTVIPNPVDVDAIQPLPAEDNPWLAALGLPDSATRVVYAGNFGHAQGLDTVLEAARRLADRDDIQWLLVGAGEGKAATAAAAVDVANVHVLPFAPARQVLAAGHVGLVPLKAGMGHYLVPSKAINYLAAGTPIIAAGKDGDDLAELVAAAACGAVVPPGDAAALAAAVKDAADRPQRWQTMGHNGRDWVVRHFAGQVIAARYNQLLRSLMAQRNGTTMDANAWKRS